MDKKIKCNNCRNVFVWSKEEQIIYTARKLKSPDYCPICRGIMEARSRDKLRNKYER